jgi:hypothetical protein
LPGAADLRNRRNQARSAAAKEKDDMADTLMYIAEHGGIAAFVHGSEE